jgi:hypothetical protein
MAVIANAVAAERRREPGQGKEVLAVLDPEPLFQTAILKLFQRRVPNARWGSIVRAAFENRLSGAMRHGGEFRCRALPFWEIDDLLSHVMERYLD